MDTSKVIRGVVNSGRYTVTAPIVKEDYGLYLQIEGVELPQTYEVDFSNSENSGTSVTMIGNSDGVLIPHQFISTGKDIFAFLYHVGTNYGRTVYKFRIPNKCRPDRTDDTPTPEEQSVIDQAINALNEAVGKTAEDVESADQSAQSARDDADKAEQARDDAQTYANNAQRSTEASGQSASASAQSASASARSEENARGYAQRAEDALEEFTTPTASATTLPEGSNATASYADGNFDFGIPKGDTGESPVALRLSKDVVYVPMDREYRTKIAISDNINYEYRRGDEQIDGIMDYTGTLNGTNITCTNVRACTSTQSGYMRFTIPQGVPLRTNEDTQLIVNFRFVFDYTDLDGNRKTIARGINFVGVMDGEQGIQGERGLTGATGATGATPNMTIGTVETLEPTESATATITGTPENPVLNLGIPQGDTGEVTTEEFLKAFVTDTASGAVASFSDGADGLPLKSLVVNIDPVQDTSGGDPSPENLCPISGWTQVNVNHSDADMTNPTTITIDLGQTVYGGKLDVLTGKLTVDRAVVDLGTLTWNYVASSAFNFRSSELIGAKPPANAVVKPNAICSILPVLDYTAISAPVDGITIIFATSAQAGKVWAHSGTYTDATAFKSAVTGQTLVYELAEPIEIQLSANQINSLYGVNNLWADSGDTEVVYRADTKLFIERLTAPDSADMIADSNIVSGQYFMVGNSLYKATANIANGSAIVVGTNATRVSLAQALNEINA